MGFALALLLVLGGCAAKPAPAERPSAPAPSHQENRVRREKWARFDEVSAWPAATDKPFPSRGHGAGQYEVTVKLEPSQRAHYLELGGRAELPQGAVVAAFHRDARTGQPGPVYVMQKETEGWAYSAFDAEGLATEHGVLSLCQRCHLESPSGGLFGLPRSLQQ